MQAWEYAVLTVRLACAAQGTPPEPAVWVVGAWAGNGTKVYSPADSSHAYTAGHLSVLGAQGWELTGVATNHGLFSGGAIGLRTVNSVIDYMFWLKRPIAMGQA